MAGSIWSGERCQSSSAVSLIFGQFKLRCSLCSFFSFDLCLHFDGVTGVSERDGWLLKLWGLFHQLPLTGLALGLISDAGAIQMVCRASIGAQPNKNQQQKTPPNQNKHTLFFVSRAWAPPTSLFLELPLILKCPLALGSLTAPWQQLRPSTKQCNVYS